MAGIEHKQVDGDEAGMRLDRWFKVHYPGLGFGQLQKLLRSGQVRACSPARRSAFPRWRWMRRNPAPSPAAT